MGLTKQIDISNSAVPQWKNGIHSPSLLNCLLLFLVSDGRIGIFDLLSHRDQTKLERYLMRIPRDRVEEMRVEFQNHFNNYAQGEIGYYLEDEDCL